MSDTTLHECVASQEVIDTLRQYGVYIEIVSDTPWGKDDSGKYEVHRIMVHKWVFDACVAFHKRQGYAGMSVEEYLGKIAGERNDRRTETSS